MRQNAIMGTETAVVFSGSLGRCGLLGSIPNEISVVLQVALSGISFGMIHFA